MKSILLICLLVTLFVNVKTNLIVDKPIIDGSPTPSFSCSKKICTGDCNGKLDGCCRYYKGYNVGGDEEFKVIIHGIESDCDCIDQCYLNRDKCASYVWKFDKRICSTHRICILYKNTIAPPGTWGGSEAPQCKDLYGKYDSNCTSGTLNILQGGTVKC